MNSKKWLIVLLVILFVLVIVFLFLWLKCRGGGSIKCQSLQLDYDYLKGTTFDEDDGLKRKIAKKLESSYPAGGIQVTTGMKRIDLDPPPGAEGMLNFDLYPCTDRGEIDSVLLEGLASQPSKVDTWNVYGLLVPCCAGTIGYGLNESECPPADSSSTSAILGMLWFLPPVDAVGLGYRQSFLVFDNPLKGKSVLKRASNAVHELGHVLNLHHEEYDADGALKRGRLGSKARSHLLEHREPDASYLKPGRDSKKFCEVVPEHVPDLHESGSSECLITDKENERRDWEDFEELHNALALTVRPEKTTYFPGEPFRVDVTLALSEDFASGDRIYFPSDAFLDPVFGFFTFYTSGPNGNTRIGRPILAEMAHELHTLKPGDEITASGIDLWFPSKLDFSSAGLMAKQTFILGAQLTGLEVEKSTVFNRFLPPYFSRLFARSTKKSLHSGEFEINVHADPPSFFDAGAFERFRAPQSQRLMYLLSGDHLSDGFNKFETISITDSGTIFAPYADLALGLRWGRPFRGFALDRTKILRGPDHPRAKKHLEKAQQAFAGMKETSPSYDRLLNLALGFTFEKLGDEAAASNPEAARNFYGKALDQVQSVSTGCRSREKANSYISQNISNTADGAEHAIAADVDLDGDLDVVSASETDNTIAWHENSAGDGSSWSFHQISNTAGGATSVSVQDLDQDGDPDVISASFSDNQIIWHENILTFSGPTWTPRIIHSALGPTSVVAADMNGDGEMNILSSSLNDDKIVWYENTPFVLPPGPGIPVAMTVWTPHLISASVDMATSAFAADIDGDGDMDVLSSALIPSKIAWHENTDGNGTMWVQHTISLALSGPQSVFAADVDNDGDIDALSASASDDKIAWYENTVGDGSNWVEHPIASHPVNPADGATSVFAKDLDCDGDMDVLTASANDDRIAWHENANGTGTFWVEHTITSAADFANSVFAGDLDGDGDWDVLSTSGTDDSVSWYKNEGISPLSYTELQARSDAQTQILRLAGKLSALPPPP